MESIKKAAIFLPLTAALAAVSPPVLGDLQSDCVDQYVRGGAYPGDRDCDFNASRSRGDFLCTGSSAIHLIQEYCAGQLGAGTDPSDNGDPGCNGAGNPINVSNGNKYQKEHDYTDYAWIAGETPLAFSRYYNSNMLTKSGSFGVQWRGSFDRTLSIDYGQLRITATRHTGEEIQFRPTTGCPAQAGKTCNDFLSSLPGDGEVTWLPSGKKISYISAIISGGVISEWTLHDYNEDVIETYNASGQLTSIRSPKANQKLDLTYSSGRLDSVVNNHGRTLTFGYDAYNRVTSMVVPGGKTYTYTYVGAATTPLQYVIYPDATTASTTDNPRRQYLYEQRHNALTGIIDEEGHRYATWRYDGYNRAIFSTHAGDAGRVDVAYSDTNATVKIKTEDTRTRDIIYNFSTNDNQKILSSINGSAGTNCSATINNVRYNSDGLINRIQSPEGWINEYEYDQGKISKITEGLGGTLDSPITRPETRVKTIQWDFDTLTPTELDQDGENSVFTYENGRISTISKTDMSIGPKPYPVSGRLHQWSYHYTYHDAGQSLVASIDIDGPRTDVNDISHYEYNSSGFLTLNRDANGRVWRIVSHYDDGAPLRIEGPNGVVILFTYTSRGWVQRRTVTGAGTNEVTGYEYFNNGLVRQITLPNGAQYNFLYDDAHRVTSIKDRLSNEVAYTLNSLDKRKRIQIKDSSGAIQFDLQREFDDLGRLWKIMGLNSEVRNEYHYNANSMLSETINGNQVSSFQGFDALNRLTSVTDESGNDILITRDAGDRVLSVTDQNNLTTRYTYDGFGFLIQSQSPDAGTQTYWRDAAGNLTRVVDANAREKVITYDALNRPTAVSYTGQPSKNLTFVYDELSTYGITNSGTGRLTRIEQVDGYSLGFIYNAAGKITQQLTVLGANSYIVQYSYAANGNMTGLTYPSGTSVGYSYDTQGNASGITIRQAGSTASISTAKSVKYKPFGPVAQFTMGNGLVVDSNYDLHYRPSGGKTTGIMDSSIGYDPVGNIESITERLNAQLNQSFEYSSVGRLTSAQSLSGGNFTFDYDPVGNSTAKTWSSGSNSSSDVLSTNNGVSNRLNRVERTESGTLSVIDVDYNSAGSVVDFGNMHFNIDRNERTQEVHKNGTLVASYAYNGMGQRVQKIVAGNTDASRRFVYDTDGKLLSEMTISGAPIRDYVYLNGKLVNMVDAGTSPTADILLTFKGTSGKFQKDTQTISYQVVVTNNGPSSANNVVATQLLPEGVSLVSATPSTGSCDSGGLVCHLGEIESKQSVTIDTLVSTAVEEKMFFTASVTADTVDVNIENNTKAVKLGGAIEWFSVLLLAAMGTIRKIRAHLRLSQGAVFSLGAALGLVLFSGEASADIYYVSNDHRGAPVAITDSNKNVVWRGQYKPFGEAVVSVGFIENNVRLPGQYLDRETGLHYNYFRDYDPSLGRYVESDPIGLRGGVNLYAYVYGNPVSFIDPYGLWCLGPGTIGAISGAVGGMVGGAITGGVEGAAIGSASGPLGALAGLGTGMLQGGMRGGVAGAIGGALGSSVGGATGGALGGLLSGIPGGVDGMANGMLGGALGEATGGGTIGGAIGGFAGGLGGSTSGMIGSVVGGYVGGAVQSGLEQLNDK